MKKTQKYRIESLRLKLNSIQYLGHFSFVLIPLLLPGMELYYKLTNGQTSNAFPFYSHLLVLLLTGIIIYVKWKELHIKRIYEIRTDKQFKDAVFATANKLNWDIEKLDKQNIIAYGNRQWSSQTAKIQINRKPGYVEVSSIFQPFLSPPDLFGRNRKNMSTFLYNYILSNKEPNINETTVNKIKEEEERIENESEWNFKNALKRIVAYIVSLGFLALGWAIYKSDGFSFLILILAIVGLFYPAVDIYVMIKKARASS